MASAIPVISNRGRFESQSKATSIFSNPTATMDSSGRPVDVNLETEPISIDHSRLLVSRNTPNLSSQNGFAAHSRKALDIVAECPTHVFFEKPLPVSKGIPTEWNKSVADNSFDIGIPQSVNDIAYAPEVGFGGETGPIIQVPLCQIDELCIPFTPKSRATPSSYGRHEPCPASTKEKLSEYSISEAELLESRLGAFHLIPNKFPRANNLDFAIRGALIILRFAIICSLIYSINASSTTTNPPFTSSVVPYKTLFWVGYPFVSGKTAGPPTTLQTLVYYKLNSTSGSTSSARSTGSNFLTKGYTHKKTSTTSARPTAMKSLAPRDHLSTVRHPSPKPTTTNSLIKRNGKDPRPTTLATPITTSYLTESLSTDAEHTSSEKVMIMIGFPDGTTRTSSLRPVATSSLPETTLTDGTPTYPATPITTIYDTSTLSTDPQHTLSESLLITIVLSNGTTTTSSIRDMALGPSLVGLCGSTIDRNYKDLRNRNCKIALGSVVGIVVVPCLLVWISICIIDMRRRKQVRRNRTRRSEVVRQSLKGKEVCGNRLMS